MCNHITYLQAANPVQSFRLLNNIKWENLIFTIKVSCLGTLQIFISPVTFESSAISSLIPVLKLRQILHCEDRTCLDRGPDLLWYILIYLYVLGRTTKDLNRRCRLYLGLVFLRFQENDAAYVMCCPSLLT